MVQDNNVITVHNLLKQYKAWVESGDIGFLEKGQKDVLEYVEDLIEKFDKAEKEAVEKGEDISRHLNWYETHKTGRKLWERLASCALDNIDPNSKGNSTLFGFLKAATEFEDLLYGLERYYRDHTLHSLWVYFLGEHILRGLIPDVRDNLNWYLFNDIEDEKDNYDYPENLVECARSKAKEIESSVDDHKDAIWCLMALCHDLGYSLAKLKNLNEKVEAVLDFLDVADFKHIGYTLDIEQQYLVSQFLEIMAMDVRIVPSRDYKESKKLKDQFDNKDITEEKYEKRLKEKVLIKCYRDDATYWQLCKALEKRQHGILSSFLMYKIVSMFAEAWVRGPGEEWGLQDTEAIDNIIRGDILFAMAQHTFDFAYLDGLNSLGDILVLADEIEEFSRLGRDMLSREYHDTTANVKIEFDPPKPKTKEDICIKIFYEVAEHLDDKGLKMFFERKTKQLCKMYTLGQDEKSAFGKIKSIEMHVGRKDEKTEGIYFRLHQDAGKTEALLPKYGENKADKYPVRCYEDKLLVGETKIPLDKWLELDSK